MLNCLPHGFFRISLLLSLLLSTGQFATAQIAEQVYSQDYKINPERAGELSIDIDNMTFFKNNEFEGDIIKGYTLPGLWFQAKAVYHPLENIKLEAGFHSLYFHGAKKYPSYAYLDITTWNPESYQSGVHLLPYFRAHMALSDNVDLVLGNIYGGSNHRLIAPLYNPELNLTADPEVGLQLLYQSRFIDLDTWINWQSFAFRMDTHQEAFTAGLSTRLKFNSPDSRFHVYMPLQALVQHRGGELDTLTANSVQTFMNGAAGLGLDWNVGYSALKNINVEADFLGYYQESGKLWPLNDGYAYFLSASADIYDFRVKVAYLRGSDFISMFGSPLYGAVSTAYEHVYVNPSTCFVGLEYSRSFGKAYNLGVELEYYITSNDGFISFHNNEVRTMKSGASFSAGVYLRVSPSFLVKSFR